MKTETKSENYYEITWEGVLYGSNGSEDPIPLKYYSKEEAIKQFKILNKVLKSKGGQLPEEVCDEMDSDIDDVYHAGNITGKIRLTEVFKTVVTTKNELKCEFNE